MIQFVHLPGLALASTRHTAVAALPRFSGTARAQIAAALRRKVRSGEVPAAEVSAIFQHGIAGTDGAVEAIGRKLTQRATRRRPCPRVALPANYVCRFDPALETPQVKQSIRYWMSALVRHGVVTPARLRRAQRFGAGGLATLVRAGCREYMRATVRAFSRSLGLNDTFPDSALVWKVGPASLSLAETSDFVDDVLVYPDDNPCGFSATQLPTTDALPGLMDILACLSTSRWNVISLFLPSDLASESATGGMMFEEFDAYRDELVAKDGSVAFTDAFREHMSYEYGLDLDDESAAERVRRYYAFHTKSKEARLVLKTVREAAKHLATMAGQPEFKAASAVLRQLAAWLATSERKPIELAINPLNEEGYFQGVHVICADLTGFESGVLDDMHDANMNVGCEGAITINASDPFRAFEVAVMESCRITVLNQLLLRYVELMA